MSNEIKPPYFTDEKLNELQLKIGSRLVFHTILKEEKGLRKNTIRREIFCILIHIPNMCS